MKTPELDKMLQVKEKSQNIGEFLEWLQDTQKISLCKYKNEEIIYIDKDFEERVNACDNELDKQALRMNNPNKVNYVNAGWHKELCSIESILAEYFQIDLIKAEKERSALLQSIRESNKK